jgi:hypothetical protein
MKDAETLLNDITFMALDHGMNSIEGGAGPLIPFAVTESASGEKSIHRFATDQLEDGLEAAKKHVDGSRGSIVRYAIAWDGFVTINGKKWDAVLVEAGDCQSDTGYLMIQRYEKKGLIRKKNVPHGNAGLAGRPQSRLK